MLDPRIYRAGWIPVLFAVVVVAFSLGESPPARTSSLSAQSFDGRAAAARAERVAAEFPARTPGSAGDRALAARVARELAARGFTVARRTWTGDTARGERELVAVTAERTGFSDRRLVVVADRSAERRGAAPEATATTGLLELARVIGGRTLGRTVVLASVSGGPGGAGTRDLVDHLGGPTDAVVVLGDLAGVPPRAGTVVPWADAPGRAAPLDLRRTVGAALRLETARAPGEPGPLEQFGRLAFPLTLGAQGQVLERGVPAVLVSASGERGPSGDPELDAARLAGVGRGTLRALTALDRGPAPGAPARYLVWEGQVVPEWAVRLLTGALFVPVALAILDGLARVSRRRGRPLAWLGWALAGALPFVLAVLLARGLGALGLGAGTPGGTIGAAGSTGDGAWIAVALVLLCVLAGWLGLRPLVARALRLTGAAGAEPGAAGGALAVGLAGALALWVVNPFASALVLPALHGWTLAVAPAVRPRRAVALALVAVASGPLLLLAVGYAAGFGLGPLDALRTGVLAVAGGAVGLVPALAWAGVLGALGSVLAVARRARPGLGTLSPGGSVRGPASYAGPGSLGGTESALRR